MCKVLATGCTPRTLGSTAKENAACTETPLEGVPECCSGARARRERRRRWYVVRGRPPGAGHVTAALFYHSFEFSFIPPMEALYLCDSPLIHMFAARANSS